ncbi:hypothetical protein JKG68_30485 [Microvirga aerilata]|uniref:Uncharacterized protein n=1 Tax=Microvirga aerilata TaxID=670292 RepID=A0A936ZB86_9HYPH|nr:hypothetical protein [Microvirga aerilata]MBL0408213.1 hypothetical protein [Microvirga aerilata]
MTRAQRGWRPQRQTVSHEVSDTKPAATVASLGVQVDPERDRAVANLLTGCERLREVGDRLLTRVADLLRAEASGKCLGQVPHPRTLD